jgi:transposase
MCLQENRLDAHPETLSLRNTPEVLQQWLEELGQRFGGQEIALCFEQPAGALLHQLAGCHFVQLYAINPLTLARYRQTFTTSRAKDDRRDARCLMEIVRDHRDKIAPWQADLAQTRVLTALVEARRAAVDLRTQLSNRLKTHLKSYFPQALELVGDHLHTALCCDLLLRWPALQELKRVRATTLERFYIEHRSRQPAVIARRVQLIKAGVPVSAEAALLTSAVLTTQMLAGQLKQLSASVAAFDAKIAELFHSHEDAFIFASLPGAGSVFSARLLTGFGSDRTRFASAQEVQKYSGIAPVIKQSGQNCVVQRRRACPRFLHQSLVEYAAKSILHCAWAKAFYEQQRAQGKGYWAAVRALAFKWIRIIFRCWQERVAYDDDRYLQGLRRSRSPLVARLAVPA